jgi:2-polyprenyl-3-methyl-5-hydroxy-6-metoxy-1,4-benzoquinol methylase
MLVGIANYGTGNRQHLERLLHEYRGMPWQVDVVIFSNIPKDFGPGVEVIVGVPTSDPWSLPFAHKKVLAERVDRYDLFIYSEDDTLITRHNVEAFLDASRFLPPDDLAGFIRTEQCPDGSLSFPEVHGSFRWDPESVRTHGPYVSAYFSNEHAACYLLTRQQLKRAIASGGFLVPPHEGRYDLMVSAATDVYTQCGFRKVICVSHLDDFCVPHLPNKYIGRIGLEEKYVRQQIAALTRPGAAAVKKHWATEETRMNRSRWSRELYSPVNTEALELLPKDVKTVLSIGCDLGSTERELVARGVHVAGIPTDSVTASCAAAGGVEIIDAELDEAIARLRDRRFDAILCLDVLHLTADPVALCRSARKLMRPGGVFVVSTPQTGHVGNKVRRLLRSPANGEAVDYPTAGVQWVTERGVRRMFRRCGFRVDRVKRYVSDKGRRLNRLTGGLAEALLAAEFLITGTAKA